MSAPPFNLSLGYNALGDAQVDDHRWVLMPWRVNDLQISGATGAAVESFNGAISNSDGTKTGLNIYLPADATLQTYAIVRFGFTGTSLALRIAQDPGATATLPVGCSIDGQAFEVFDPPHTRLKTQDVFSYDYAGEGFVTVSRSLPEGPHICELTFPCDISVIRRWRLHGYAIEKRTLDRVVPPSADFAGMSLNALTDTNAHAMPMVVGTFTSYGIKALYFLNNSGSSITFSIYRASADATASPATPFKQIAVPAGSTAEWVLPAPSAAPLYVQSSSASGAYYFVLGDCG